MKVIIQFEDQHHYWKHYGTYHHQPSSITLAQQLAQRRGTRFRVVDENGVLLDLLYP